MRRAQKPRQRGDALSRLLRGCGRAVVAAPAARCGVWRGGDAGGCGLPLRSLRSLARHAARVAIDLAFALRLRLGLCTRLFPRLGPPGPPFRMRPFSSADHRPGENPSPFTHFVRSLGATARRPFSFMVPPPFGSPRRNLPAAH
mgnify:CR=1 FL=1